MNSKRRYQITEGSTVRDVFPINDSSIKYTYQKLDDEKVFYLRKLKNKLVFTNNAKNSITDFTFFYNYEKFISTRCTEFTIDIFKLCNGIEILEYTGTFSLNEADWDLDRCKVEISINSTTPYDCIKKNSKRAFNILDLPNIVTTKTDLAYNYEFHYCIGVGANLGAACVPPGPQAGAWSTFHQEVFTFNDTSAAGVCAQRIENITIYYREFVVTSCLGGSVNPPPGTGWLLHTNNCSFNSTSKWVRSPLAGPITGINLAVGYGWYNPTTGQDEFPPHPSTKSITVTATPASETSLLHNPQMFFCDPLSGMTVKFRIEVLNNPNSSYAWSLSPLTTATATVTGVGSTNKCDVTPTSSGTLKVRLTETHGNSYVSIQDYTFNVLFMGCSATPYVINAGGFSISKTREIDGEAYEHFVPEAFVCTGFTSTSNWNFTYSGTFNFVGGSGNSISGQMNGGAFTITAEQTFFKTGSNPLFIIYRNVTNVSQIYIPDSDPIYLIKEMYPNEIYQASCVKLSSGTTITLSPTWYINNTNQGPGTLVVGNYWYYGDFAPASPGSFCLAIKENINYTASAFGFQLFKIIPSINQIGFGRTPPIYYAPSTGTFVSYTRGRLFQDACEYVLQSMGCSVTDIVSDFFEWNPPGDAPGYSLGVNYVTGSLNKLTHLTISQKSDVISPTSSNAATLGELTFDQIEKIWAWMFNAFWYIDPLTNKMRVEHISFFNKVVAYDTTVSPLLKWNEANNKWSYDKSKMPKYERFKFADGMMIDFIGADIYYDNTCVDQNSESNVKERFLDYVSTDLYNIYLNPADLDKRGFVLFCNNKSGSFYTVDIEQGLISTSYLSNGHLSWANLHYAYHRHNRVLPNGFMNNLPTVFLSTIKTKQQKNVKIPKCCSDSDFNPQDILIKTGLGNGVVAEAEEDTQTHLITTTILHD